jgi:alkane 1-monooxygenase
MRRWLPHTLGLLTPLVTIAGLFLGKWWMGSTIFLALFIYPLIDFIAGKSEKVEPAKSRTQFDFIIHAHGILVPVVIGLLFWKVLTSPFDNFLLLGIVSVGLSSGASGIITAHELGHRKPKSFSWWLARLDLLCVNYLHFTVEHNHTHHKHWARPVDPTTAPMGRNVYFHFIRTIPLQIIGAYRARPKDVMISFFVEFLVLCCLLIFSKYLLLAFIIQSLVAIFLLEFVNYLQHYGLSRGMDERANATHAWESRHRWSRWTLMELPLHPSHHLQSSRPYHKLEMHDEAPQLPNGYYVMFWTALIPPLFHYRMKNALR